jgi:hypothetical protein
MAFERLMRDVLLDLHAPLTLFCDNTQTIRLVVEDNSRISTKLRHIDIHNMWARQEHAKGSFRVEHIPTDRMPADGLTKALPRLKYERWRAVLNFKDIRHLIEGSKAQHETIVL